MFASRQVEIQYYRGFGRQSGRGFGALAQVIGRTTIPFLRKYIVPAAKRIGADMLEFAAPEIGDVISGAKSFKLAAKIVGKQAPKKQLGSGSKQKKIIPTNSSVAKRHIYKGFWLIMSNSFRYQPFVSVSGNLGWKVPFVDDVFSLHEPEKYPITSIDENCIKFEFQTDLIYYVDLRQSLLA